METNKRIIWIDWTKSICMFLVILGHCHMQESDLIFITTIYSYHIPLFFFISGILCKITSKTYIYSTLKDLKHIIIPYLTFGFISAAFQNITSKEFILSDYCFKLLFGLDASIGAIWFLPALFFCKQFFYAAVKIKQFKSYLYFGLVATIFIIPYFIDKVHLNLPFFIDSALFGLPFFLAGHSGINYLNKYVIYNKKIGQAVLSGILFATTILLAYTNGFVNLSECSYGHSFLIFYCNAFTGIIATITLGAILKQNIYPFIITTSYGTIVTLGLHGYFLSLFHFHLPRLIGLYTPTYPIYLGILYSSFTYFICSFAIKWIDTHTPIPFGLRGKLSLHKCI